MFELRKIGIIKRASAWLLDLILLAVLATGFIWIVSLICKFDHHWVLANQYLHEYEEFEDTYIGKIASAYDSFNVEEHEDGTYTVTTKDGNPASPSDVINTLINDTSRSEEMQAIYDVYQSLTPPGKVNAQWRYVASLLFMMISIGIMLSYLVLEFILPIILKNGQTVGKKVFGIALVHPDCVKIKNVALFARTFLGKFAIETMFPVLLAFLFFFGGLGWIALALLAALLVLNAVLFFARKNRTPIHDVLANTVAVDMRLQMIYDSVEELNEKKALQYRENVENSKEEL